MIEVGLQTIFEGDCRDVLQTFTVGSVDVVVSSPPYNLGMEYGLYEDFKKGKDYFDFLHEVFHLLWLVLKSDGSFFLNAGFPASNPWLSYDIAKEAGKLFKLQNRICWVKSMARGDEPCVGHVKPINSDRYLNRCWEEIFHFTHRAETKLDRLAIGVPYRDKSNLTRGKRGKNGDRRCRGDAWFLPYDTIQSKEDKGKHPTVFPIQLPEYCIKLHGVRDNLVVLDPFMGIGTTLIACQRLGVTGIGIEIDPAYCKTAEEKLNAKV